MSEFPQNFKVARPPTSAAFAGAVPIERTIPRNARPHLITEGTSAPAPLAAPPRTTAPIPACAPDPGNRLSPFARTARDLLRLGYCPLPILSPRLRRLGAGKAPGWFDPAIGWRTLAEWQNFAITPPTAENLAGWDAHPETGVGIVLGGTIGSETLTGLDADTAADADGSIPADRDGAMLDTLDRILIAVVGGHSASVPIRRGRKGGLALLRLADVPETVGAKAVFTHPILGKIEVMVGGQCVVPPSRHPTTGAPYTWTRGGADGLPPAVAALPGGAWDDLVAAFTSEGFTRAIGTPSARVDEAAARAEVDGEPSPDWRERLDVAGGALGALWHDGTTPTGAHISDGSEKRFLLAGHMKAAGFAGADYAAAVTEWDHRLGDGGNEPDWDRCVPRDWSRAAPIDGGSPTSAFMIPVEAPDEPLDSREMKRRDRKSRLVTTVSTLGEIIRRGRRDKPLDLWEGLIGRRTIIDVFSPYGMGKSIVLAEVIVGIATGGTVAGRKCARGAVVVAGYENHHGLAATIAAIAARDGHDLGTLPIVFVAPDETSGKTSLPLLNGSDDPVALFASYAAQARDRFGLDVALVAVDTRSKASPGLRENEPADVSRLIAVADDIIAATGGALWFNSHPPKNAPGSSAGSYKWGSDAASILSLEELPNGRRLVTSLKAKDGRFGATAEFEIDVRPSVLPVAGEDGEPLPRSGWGTVAVAKWIRDFDFDRAGGKGERRKSTSGWTLAILNALDPDTLTDRDRLFDRASKLWSEANPGRSPSRKSFMNSLRGLTGTSVSETGDGRFVRVDGVFVPAVDEDDEAD